MSVRGTWSDHPGRRDLAGMGRRCVSRGGAPRGHQWDTPPGSTLRAACSGAGKPGTQSYLRSARRASRGRPHGLWWGSEPAPAAQLGLACSAVSGGGVVRRGRVLALADRMAVQEEGPARHRRRCRFKAAR
ncbi:hypothetical protein JTE90_028200 [Oedothorax gibbosus]|uniref:Uncharacterized protein n=1 Tax=Oedothorax gibbosus TaxID=931172 RepID=A0AAV6TMQ2_9ARAC|nr:hypothetical protein JTE90_028200 [Oedothorax gibbosus]